MTTQRAAWHVVFLTYPCPTCGAAVGDDCMTSGGKRADYVHAERTRHAARCPRCGTILSHEDDPGALCARCSLLRSLEIERATKWRRRNV